MKFGVSDILFSVLTFYKVFLFSNCLIAYICTFICVCPIQIFMYTIAFFVSVFSFPSAIAFPPVLLTADNVTTYSISNVKVREKSGAIMYSVCCFFFSRQQYSCGDLGFTHHSAEALLVHIDETSSSAKFRIFQPRVFIEISMEDIPNQKLITCTNRISSVLLVIVLLNVDNHTYSMHLDGSSYT